MSGAPHMGGVKSCRARCTRNVWGDQCLNPANGPDGLCGLHRRQSARAERLAAFPAEACASFPGDSPDRVTVDAEWLVVVLAGGAA